MIDWTDDEGAPRKPKRKELIAEIERLQERNMALRKELDNRLPLVAIGREEIEGLMVVVTQVDAHQTQVDAHQGLTDIDCGGWRRSIPGARSATLMVTGPFDSSTLNALREAAIIVPLNRVKPKRTR